MAQRIQQTDPAPCALRVLPRGTALVQDYAALLDTGTNRFHGWKWDAELGPLGAGDDGSQHHGGRVKLVDQVVEIPGSAAHRADYLKHLQNGDLWPADEATAQAAGIAHEPDFGGEHPGESAKLQPRKLSVKRESTPSV